MNKQKRSRDHIWTVLCTHFMYMKLKFFFLPRSFWYGDDEFKIVGRVEWRMKIKTREKFPCQSEENSHVLQKLCFQSMENILWEGRRNCVNSEFSSVLLLLLVFLLCLFSVLSLHKIIELVSFWSACPKDSMYLKWWEEILSKMFSHHEVTMDAVFKHKDSE
jgi:hypothetical protein